MSALHGANRIELYISHVVPSTLKFMSFCKLQFMSHSVKDSPQNIFLKFQNSFYNSYLSLPAHHVWSCPVTEPNCRQQTVMERTMYQKAVTNNRQNGTSICPLLVTVFVLMVLSMTVYCLQSPKGRCGEQSLTPLLFSYSDLEYTITCSWVRQGTCSPLLD